MPLLTLFKRNLWFCTFMGGENLELSIKISNSFGLGNFWKYLSPSHQWFLKALENIFDYFLSRRFLGVPFQVWKTKFSTIRLPGISLSVLLDLRLYIWGLWKFRSGFCAYRVRVPKIGLKDSKLISIPESICEITGVWN